MTSIDELRRLLDERGIEYVESQDRFSTRFRFNYCEACDDYLDEIDVMGACIIASKNYLTPEQAIAATLGAGECEMETDWDYLTNGIPDAPEDTWAYKCSSCGWSFRYKPTYCPHCGAKEVNHD